MKSQASPKFAFLLSAGLLLLIWGYFEQGSLDCIGAYNLGVFHFLTLSGFDRFVIHWPGLHLSLIASIVIVIGAKHWPGLLRRLLRPNQYDDEPNSLS